MNKCCLERVLIESSLPSYLSSLSPKYEDLEYIAIKSTHNEPFLMDLCMVSWSSLEIWGSISMVLMRMQVKDHRIALTILGFSSTFILLNPGHCIRRKALMFDRASVP